MNIPYRKKKTAEGRFVEVRGRFSLFSGHLLKTQSMAGKPQGNWRWNLNSRDVVACSPSFSCPAARVPQRACSQALILGIKLQTGTKLP